MPHKDTFNIDIVNDLYQKMLARALDDPKLLHKINRLFGHLFFKKGKHFIDTPEKALTFDCLFPQHTIEYSIPVEHTKEAM